MPTFGGISIKRMIYGDNVLLGRKMGLVILLLNTTLDYEYIVYVFFHWM